MFLFFVVRKTIKEKVSRKDMILSCQNICKSFGVEDVLKNVSFGVEEYEKAAIVGMNGAGKSTLLKIIMGELQADSGQVTVSKGKTIGYLAQHQDVSGGRTIYEEVLEEKRALLDMEERIRQMELEMDCLTGEALEAHLNEYHKLMHEFEALDGYAYKSEVSGILKGLGFQEQEFDHLVEELSGGQKTRVALARLLVSRPDIILLDEPTNHLDIDSITWLETFLLNYKGAVVIVAHDRYFLDRIVSKIVEISMHQCTVFQGNYTTYAEKKKQLRDAQLRAYLNQQREIKHQEAVIEKLKSYNREKSIKRAESREKLLDKMEVLEKPQEEQTEIRLQLTPEIVSGNDVLSVKGLGKAYGDKHLFSGIDFEIKRGERVALIGQNGTGKTTILKILNELVPADAGEFRLGSNVKIGYYDQEHQVLHMDKTVFSEIADAYPRLTETRIRTLLAAFLFTGEDVYKRISDLSGGERGRVSLAKLMLSEANFLILDEPTNHLDITSKEILESALLQYEGTVLFVSHDRYFINKTATRILNLTEQQVINYIGNYDYYLEKKADLEAILLQGKTENGKPVFSNLTAAQPAPVESEGKQDWKKQKEEQAKIRKRENELKKVESQIEELEDKIAQIDTQFEKPEIATNSAKLGELTKEKDGYQQELDVLYQRWEELA